MSDKFSAILTGDAGSGKTTLLAKANNKPHIGNMLFIDYGGTAQVSLRGLNTDSVEVASEQELSGVIDKLPSQYNKYQTVVLDGGDTYHIDVLRKRSNITDIRQRYFASFYEVGATLDRMKGLPQSIIWVMHPELTDSLVFQPNFQGKKFVGEMINKFNASMFLLSRFVDEDGESDSGRMRRKLILHDEVIQAGTPTAPSTYTFMSKMHTAYGRTAPTSILNPDSIYDAIQYMFPE